MTSACPACDVAPLAVETAGAATVLSLPGIHCAGCIGKIETALGALPGVASARVNLTEKRVRVVTDRAPADLVSALAEAGFEAHPLNQEVLPGAEDPAGRDLLLRLGVAGFAMMNVMLLSVAVWSGAESATRDLFHLISAAISLPVVAYSGQPFFRNAWAALTAWRLNMDVPISLAILLAAVMSLYEALHGGHHAYFDAALSLTFFLLIGRYLDHRTRGAARSAAAELSALEAATARRLVNGEPEEVRLDALAKGDEILIPTGTRVPVDGVLLSRGAVTDRAFLTGESDPITSAKGAALQAGEINLGRPFRVQATAVGEDTTLRRVAALVETAEVARNRYTALADRAARIYAPAVHLLAAAAFLGWWAASGDLRLALNIAIAVLIITCPCALGLAVPAVSTAAVGRLFKQGVLVTSGTALERLAEVDTVVFDKTGTLTLPRATAPALSSEERMVARALAAQSDHPVSRALARALEGVPSVRLSRIHETKGQGISGFWEGQEVRLGRGDWIGAPFDGLGLRIGARVMRLGQVEELRPGAREALEALKARGLRLVLLSGDREAAVAALADLPFDEMHSQKSGEEKHAFLQDLTAKGATVAMVGDGLNDAPSLAAAHASLAPGTALDAARMAADIVLLRPSLAVLPEVFSTAKAAVRRSRENFAIAGGYNAIAVPVALAGFATPLAAALAMSFSSLTVLLNALRLRISS